MNKFRLLWSIAICSLVLTLPSLGMLNINFQPANYAVDSPFMIALFPGIIAAIALSGNAHAFSTAVSIIVSFLVDTSLLYLVISLLSRLIRKRTATAV